MMGYQRGKASAASITSTSKQLLLVLAGGVIVGYILGTVVMETADRMFSIGAEHHIGEANSIPSATLAVRDLPSQTTSTSTNNADSSHHETTVQLPKPAAKDRPAGDTIHSLLTSNGSPYQNFQTRIMYGTYQLVQKMPGGEKLTGFTRILHRMTDDNLMNEIPTYRVRPLHPKCDVYCDFPVADRPNAVQAWVNAAAQDPSMIQGAWLLLVEADYVWMKPMQAPNAYSDAPGLLYHFDYIIPTWKGVTETLIRLSNANNLDVKGAIPPAGSAPALLRFADLQKINPVWELITAAIENDKEAVDLMGWVREMYAWDVGVVASGVKMETQEPGKSILLAQPPHDTTLGNACICHYTWGAIYNDTKGEVWRWEKREYTRPEHALKVPHIPMPPQPFQPGAWHLQDKLPVTKELHETLTAMLGQMNKAIDLLPDLTPRK